MTHISNLRRKWFNFTEKRLNFFNNLSTLLAFAIAIVFFFTLKKEVKYHQNSNNQTSNQSNDFSYWANLAYFILGLMQMATCATIFIYWARIYLPLIIARRWRENIAYSSKNYINKELEEECFYIFIFIL